MQIYIVMLLCEFSDYVHSFWLRNDEACDTANFLMDKKESVDIDLYEDIEDHAQIIGIEIVKMEEGNDKRTIMYSELY